MLHILYISNIKKRQLKRKIITVGCSRGIVIPRFWLNLIKEQTGKMPNCVVLSENSGVLTIKPAIEESIHS